MGHQFKLYSKLILLDINLINVCTSIQIQDDKKEAAGNFHIYLFISFGVLIFKFNMLPQVQNH